MKVVFHKDFYRVYEADPAAAAGRMEAIVEAIKDRAEFIEAEPAALNDILRAHSKLHVQSVTEKGLYDIAALAAGGAVIAAETGLIKPCFGLIRPPGHHASRSSSWGFCYFNNMAVALLSLYSRARIKSALVLDIDLHYGDGTENILQDNKWVEIINPDRANREEYLKCVKDCLLASCADIIGISAGFDNHEKDWGGLLKTEDYELIGRLAVEAARRNRGGCFAILEGGYNHAVLGDNVMAMIYGMERP